MRTLIVFLLLAGLIAFGASRRIEKIDCQINHTRCPEKITAEFNDLIGRNFILTKPGLKMKDLTVKYPQWQQIAWQKRPLKTVAVSITTRQPVVCFLMADQKMLLDAEAMVVVEVVTNPGLPVIQAQRFEEAKVKQAIAAASLLESYHLSFDQIELTDQEKIVVRLTESELVLPLTELNEKIASLQMILSQAKIKNSLPKKIDLRFNKPILSY